MKSIKVLLLAGLFLSGFHNVYSQDRLSTRDFETWSSLTLEYDPDSKWDFSLEEMLRLKENSSIIDDYYTQVQARYWVSDRFYAGGGVRFIRNNDTKGEKQGYENFLRIQLDTGYKYYIKNLKLHFRLRYQNRNELGISGLAGDYAEQHFRFKSGFTYNIRNWRFDPVLSGEIYHFMQAGEQNGFEKYRLSFGTEFDLWDFGEIGISYKYENSINAVITEMSDILCIEYTYTF